MEIPVIEFRTHIIELLITLPLTICSNDIFNIIPLSDNRTERKSGFQQYLMHRVKSGSCIVAAQSAVSTLNLPCKDPGTPAGKQISRSIFCNYKTSLPQSHIIITHFG